MNFTVDRIVFLFIHCPKQEVDFADSLLTHAGFPEKKMGRMRKRVKKGFKDEEKLGTTFGEFMVRQVFFSSSEKKPVTSLCKLCYGMRQKYFFLSGFLSLPRPHSRCGHRVDVLSCGRSKCRPSKMDFFLDASSYLFRRVCPYACDALS